MAQQPMSSGGSSLAEDTVHGPTVDTRKWHPPITLDMVKKYDASVDEMSDILNLIVVPDGWTGKLNGAFSPGPPKGTGLTGSDENHGGGNGGDGP